MIFEKKVVQIYKNMVYTRCDDNGTAYYFSADDFEGLRRESYSFSSSLGHNLQGYIYSYDDPIKDRLVVFDHGFGGGHRSYMKEIEKLCSAGFTVFAYDHTGCMESGGENARGMAQSLHDLDDCLKCIKADSRFTGVDISVMGHSWGGFSTLNISALYPEISHVVVMSGFISVEHLVNTFFSGILKHYRTAVMALEREANPDYVYYNAVDSLKDTDAKVLLIYSDDDKMCLKNVHYDALKEGLAKFRNITLHLESGKSHNPNYTKQAVAYLNEYGEIKAKLTKKKKLTTSQQKQEFVSSFDWNRMTEQDDSVWKIIFDCLLDR